MRNADADGVIDLSDVSVSLDAQLCKEIPADPSARTLPAALTPLERFFVAVDRRYRQHQRQRDSDDSDESVSTSARSQTSSAESLRASARMHLSQAHQDMHLLAQLARMMRPGGAVSLQRMHRRQGADADLRALIREEGPPDVRADDEAITTTLRQATRRAVRANHAVRADSAADILASARTQLEKRANQFARAAHDVRHLCEGGIRVGRVSLPSILVADLRADTASKEGICALHMTPDGVSLTPSRESGTDASQLLQQVRRKQRRLLLRQVAALLSTQSGLDLVMSINRTREPLQRFTALWEASARTLHFRADAGVEASLCFTRAYDDVTLRRTDQTVSDQTVSDQTVSDHDGETIDQLTVLWRRWLRCDATHVLTRTVHHVVHRRLHRHAVARFGISSDTDRISDRMSDRMGDRTVSDTCDGEDLQWRQPSTHGDITLTLVHDVPALRLQCRDMDEWLLSVPAFDACLSRLDLSAS
ncbi:MAG: hypothetical protein MHM6MM_001385 [Cercozoa sp. M6MM]